MKTEELWGGSLLLRQEEGVFPLSADTMALADFARPKRGDRLWDLGCGSGALCLLLTGAVPDLHCTGIDLSEQAVRLTEENFRLNAVTGTALCGDLRELKDLPGGAADYAVSNPPYFGSGLSGTDARTGLRLEELIAAAARLLRNGGKLALVYPSEQLAELLTVLRQAGLEPKRLQMIAHTPSSPPKRVMVEAVRQGRPGLTLLPQLCWQDENGEKTPETKRIYHEI